VFGHGNTPAKGERSRKLRQAISMAIDQKEYSKMFPRRAGLAAIRPVPPGIFDSREVTCAGLKSTPHSWMADPSLPAGGRAVWRPIEDATALMTKGDHGGGRDERAGKLLVLRYDFYYPPPPERKPEIDRVVRQFPNWAFNLECAPLWLVQCSMLCGT